MAFKRIALAGCLLVTVKAYQIEETDPYQYYNQPTSEMVVGGDPGAALGSLALFGAAALGGLAAISAGLTQTRADNVNHHVGNTDGDISLLQLRISDLENTNGNIQSNLNRAQIAVNNAVTLAQLDTITTTTKDAQRMIDRFCHSLERSNDAMTIAIPTVTATSPAYETEAGFNTALDASVANLNNAIAAIDGNIRQLEDKANRICNAC